MGETMGTMRVSGLWVAMLIATLLAGGDLTMRYVHAANKRYKDREEVFARPEGASLRATVFEPYEAGDELRPAVVVIHGGAWATGGRYLKRWYGRRLA